MDRGNTKSSRNEQALYRGRIVLLAVLHPVHSRTACEIEEVTLISLDNNANRSRTLGNRFRGVLFNGSTQFMRCEIIGTVGIRGDRVLCPLCRGHERRLPGLQNLSAGSIGHDGSGRNGMEAKDLIDPCRIDRIGIVNARMDHCPSLWITLRHIIKPLFRQAQRPNHMTLMLLPEKLHITLSDCPIHDPAIPLCTSTDAHCQLSRKLNAVSDEPQQFKKTIIFASNHRHSNP